MAKRKLGVSIMNTWSNILSKQEDFLVQSKVDECVFYKSKTILLVHVDEAIQCGPSSKVIDDMLASLKDEFDVTIDDYLVVKVT